MQLLISLGLWNWVLLGLVLLIFELLLPGVFFIWFGLAALVTAFISALTGSFLFPFGSWHGQVVVFLVISVVLVVVGRSFFAHTPLSDNPFLNRRTDEMIGLNVILSEPIIDNHGHIRIDDTIWRVTGPDLPKGSKVYITGFANGAFDVSPEPSQQAVLAGEQENHP